MLDDAGVGAVVALSALRLERSTFGDELVGIPLPRGGDELGTRSNNAPTCDGCCPAKWKTGTVARCAISISPIC